MRAYCSQRICYDPQFTRKAKHFDRFAVNAWEKISIVSGILFFVEERLTTPVYVQLMGHCLPPSVQPVYSCVAINITDTSLECCGHSDAHSHIGQGMRYRFPLLSDNESATATAFPVYLQLSRCNPIPIRITLYLWVTNFRVSESVSKVSLTSAILRQATEKHLDVQNIQKWKLDYIPGLELNDAYMF
ncbi:hypothetical protein Trydic_g10398 [Trypoxylus dichotomus]